CGYRGSKTGALVQDPYFVQNIEGATAAGLKVGVYFFTQAITEIEAVEEASMVLALTEGYQLSMPVFIDTEGSGGRADSLNVADRTAICKAFCDTIQASGGTAGIYASRNWYQTKLKDTTFDSYVKWLAEYRKEPLYKGKYDMWQYTSSGSVNGIEGRVDLNLSYTQ
ncbi:MAG: glycoside hydrolase family 25 protein, partial [Lachnospiraceae bacterium]|nr:glycoside hydrolase family 25 protein [Lachnospiraceae bacterium]